MSAASLGDTGDAGLQERLSAVDIGSGLLAALWMLVIAVVAMWLGAVKPSVQPQTAPPRRPEATVAVPVEVVPSNPVALPTPAEPPRPKKAKRVPPPVVTPQPAVTPSKPPPSNPPPDAPAVAVPAPPDPPADPDEDPLAEEDEGTGGEPTGTLDGADFDALAAAAAAAEAAAVAAYRRRLLKWLDGRFVVEDSGLSAKELAAIKVKAVITVADDGSVGSYDLTPTGHAGVDQAARATLDGLRGQALPPPPPEYPAALPPSLRITFVCKPGVCS